MPRTVRVNRVLVPNLGHFAHFVHRDDMRLRGVFRTFKHVEPIVPPTILPVDGTGNATVSCPMDHNDQYGICGPAMCAHILNILTYGQGKPGFTEWVPDLAALLAQYLKVSGGDNGTDESMLVGSGGIWRTGLAGDPSAIVVDALDIDVTDVPLMQFAIDNFYAVPVAWSVPDAFIQAFVTGMVSAKAGIPNPNNGHYTPRADIGGPDDRAADGTHLEGFMRDWTWGTWDWQSPEFVASVQPQGFVAFSPRQFNPTTGLDSKGRHIVAQAAKWVQCGGHPIPPAVIQAFPPMGGPVNPPVPPTPPPVPPPVTQAPVASWNVPAVRKGQHVTLRTQAQADWPAADYGLTALNQHGAGSQHHYEGYEVIVDD